MHFDENVKEECVLRYSFFPEKKKNYITDAINKWLPIHYSFFLVQISLPSLIVMCLIEKNSCSRARLGRLICTITEQK